MVVRVAEHALDLVEGVEAEQVLVPVALLGHVVNLLGEGVEEHCVGVDVLKEVLACCLLVLVGLDFPVVADDVELCVEL